HTRFSRDWSSDVCSSDLTAANRFIRKARSSGSRTVSKVRPLRRGPTCPITPLRRTTGTTGGVLRRLCSGKTFPNVSRRSKDILSALLFKSGEHVHRVDADGFDCVTAFHHEERGNAQTSHTPSHPQVVVVVQSKVGNGIFLEGIDAQ